MTNISQDALKILNLWQDSLWQNLANELPLSEAMLSRFCSVQSTLISDGKIELPFCPEAKIWIAPLVYEHSTKPKHYWIPIWIPALIQAGSLAPNFEESPWIPASQCDLLTDNFILPQSLYQLEEYLRFEWEEIASTIKDWQEYYSTCLGFLDIVAEGMWQERMKAKGYLLTAKAYVADISTLRTMFPFMESYQQQLEKGELSEAIKTYAQIEDPYVESEEKALLASAFCGRYTSFAPFLESEYQAITTILGSQDSLFAVGAPVGVNKEKVIAALLASTMVSKTVLLKQKPNIYRLARSIETRRYALDPFSAQVLYPKDNVEEQNNIVQSCHALREGLAFDREQLSHTLYHQLQLQYENFVTGLNLLENTFKERIGSIFEKEGCPKQYLEALQQEDETYEMEFAELLALQEAMGRKKPESFFSRLFSRRNAEKNGSEIQKANGIRQYKTLEEIGDRIRQVKVIRAKIHLQLVTVADKMATSTHGKVWQQWLEENQFDIPKSIYKEEDLRAYIQNAFSEKLWQLAIYYWLASEPLHSLEEETHLSPLYQDFTLFKWDTQPFLGWHPVKTLEKEVALLLIEESNRLYPQHVAPLLANVNKAVLFGDEKDIGPLIATTLSQQEQAILRFGLDDEDIKEQLHYKGMMISAGNAFITGQRNSRIEEEQFEPTLILKERESVCSYFEEYLYFLNYKKDLCIFKQEKVNNCGFYALDIRGKCEYQLEGCVNMMEAQAVIEWLRTGPYATKTKEVLIVTPFVTQKRILISLLHSHQINCEVSTFYNLKDKLWQTIVFCPVLTQENPRPFAFDQGDNWIYSLIIRAKEALWVIGDLRILDPKMHSPSGCLAKVIHVNNNEQVADLVELA